MSYSEDDLQTVRAALRKLALGDSVRSITLGDGGQTVYQTPTADDLLKIEKHILASLKSSPTARRRMRSVVPLTSKGL